MLHILNSDSQARLFSRTSIPGVQLVWRESVLTGPSPGGLSTGEWIELRAQHISETYEVPLDVCVTELQQAYVGLQQSALHDEVILWFEDDLYCGLNLIHLLSLLESCAGDTRVSMIPLDQLSRGQHSGVGEMTPERLQFLFERRVSLDIDALRLGSRSWHAYVSPDPILLHAIEISRTSPLHPVQELLLLHAARFPSLKNGLGRLEHSLLEFVDAGYSRFPDLFELAGAMFPAYGIGDYQLWNLAIRLVKQPHPLLAMSGVEDETRPLITRKYLQASYRMTDDGRSVLRGKKDFIELNGIDQWLGGVQMKQGRPLWRWDENGRFLLRV